VGQKIYRRGLAWQLLTALLLALVLSLVSSFPAAAQNLEDYFQLSYEPVSLSKSEIHGSEVFQATIIGRATCNKDLPVSATEASITSRVVAEHKAGGGRVTLNSSYVVTIKPFPSKEGDIAEINQVVPLQFPAQAKSGDYDIIGELIEAKVKVGFWIEVTDYLPKKQHMSSVKYIAPESTSEPEPAPTPAPTPAPAQTPAETPAPTPNPLTIPLWYSLPWWVWLLVAVAVITTIVNITCCLRRRSS